MKLVLLNVATAKEPWAELVAELYLKKISHFIPIELLHLKPKKGGRDSAEHKKQEESALIINSLKTDDYVILFDEKGKNFSSVNFSQKLEQTLSGGKKRIIFIIGGAYGVTDEVRLRCDLMLSLSGMTMNHLMAQAVALEQIYRAFTIIKKIPYHNA